jgi:hypothetical protein
MAKPSGGMYTALGIRMQVLACIVDAMNRGLKISKLVIEPPGVPNIVDYILTDPDGAETRVQAKHSKKSWKGKDLEDWLKQLKADTSVSKKRLVLIGTIPSALADLRKRYPDIDIPDPLPLDEGIIFRALSNSIHKFAEDNKLGNPSASALKDITHTLIDKHFQASSSGSTIEGGDLRASIADAIKRVCGSAGDPNRELREISEFKQVFGFDPPRAEREAIMSFFLLAEDRIRPWKFHEARDFLDFSDGSLRVCYKAGPMFNLGIALTSMALLLAMGLFFSPILFWGRVRDHGMLIGACSCGSMIFCMPFLMMTRPFLVARQIAAVRKDLDLAQES